MPVVSTFHISSEGENMVTVGFEGGKVNFLQTRENGDTSVIQINEDMARLLVDCLYAGIGLIRNDFRSSFDKE
jgi:hypothetical protein